MIEINLLPLELRRKESGAFSVVRLVIISGVVLNCLLLFMWGWLHFVKFKQAFAELNNLKGEEKRLAIKSKEVEDLEAEITRMADKSKTVEQLWNLRRCDWVKKLMDLTIAVDKTMGWITSMRVSFSGAGGEFFINCTVIGKSMNDLVANEEQFLNRLGYIDGDKSKGFNDFWKEFISLTPDDYWKGISGVRTEGDWLVHEFDMKLEILSELAQKLSVRK